jgi:hypothetical protein
MKFQIQHIYIVFLIAEDLFYEHIFVPESVSYWGLKESANVNRREH